MNPVPTFSGDDTEAARVLSRVSDGFYALDSEWGFTYLNERAEEWLQRPVKELLGECIWDEFPEAADGIVYDSYTTAMETQEETRFDLYFEPLEKWFHVVAYPSTEGLSVYFKDITEYLLKDRAIETAEMGIVITDPNDAENPLIYANEGFERLTGYTEDEALGRNLQFLLGQDTDSKRIIELQEAIEANIPVTITLLNYRKRGIPFWNRVSVNPIFDVEGTVTHFIGFLQDVTELVEREQRVQMLNRVLRHNLRTEMNILLGNLDSIEAGLIPQSEGLGRARQAGENLLRISERVRQIDKVLSKVPFNPVATPLLDLIATTIEKTKSHFPEAEISLEIDDDVSVLGNTAVEMAIEELMANALQHNPDSPPVLTISAEMGETEQATDGEERPVIWVHFVDEAPSLTPLERQALLSAEENPLQHGTGLGLWLVHWLVTFSGGNVKYRDRSSMGNVISISLLVTDDVEA